MRRRNGAVATLSAFSAALLLWACQSVAAPDGSRAPTSAPSAISLDRGQGNSKLSASLAACSRPRSVSAHGKIGPEGGVLVFGDNLLIVPPGALTEHLELSATMNAGSSALAQLQPHGLHFQHPVTLVLTSNGCSIPSSLRPIVAYVGEDGTVLERIDASYDTHGHTIAALINHFSGYAIAF